MYNDSSFNDVKILFANIAYWYSLFSFYSEPKTKYFIDGVITIAIIRKKILRQNLGSAL